MLINGYVSELCQFMEGYDGMDTIGDVPPFIVDWIYGYYGRPGRDVWDELSDDESESEDGMELEIHPMLSSSAASGSKNRLSLSFTSLMDPVMDSGCRISDSEMEDDEFLEIPSSTKSPFHLRSNCWTKTTSSTSL